MIQRSHYHAVVLISSCWRNLETSLCTQWVVRYYFYCVYSMVTLEDSAWLEYNTTKLSSYQCNIRNKVPILGYQSHQLRIIGLCYVNGTILLTSGLSHVLPDKLLSLFYKYCAFSRIRKIVFRGWNDYKLYIVNRDILGLYSMFYRFCGNAILGLFYFLAVQGAECEKPWIK